MATATKTTKNTATATATVGRFQIVDEAPKLKSASGRAKSELRTAMEQIPSGKTMITDQVVSGEQPRTPADEKLISGVRQKAQEVNRAAGVKGMLTVGVDIENRIVVTHNGTEPQDES